VVASVDPWALLLFIGAVIAMFRFRTGMIPTLAAASGGGIALHLRGAF
jgi:chromate transporter